MNQGQLLGRITDLEGRIAELEGKLADAKDEIGRGWDEAHQRLASLEDWRGTMTKPSAARLGLNKMAAAVGGALKQD